MLLVAACELILHLRKASDDLASEDLTAAIEQKLHATHLCEVLYRYASARRCHLQVPWHQHAPMIVETLVCSNESRDKAGRLIACELAQRP
jgi:hypothetical protein